MGKKIYKVMTGFVIVVFLFLASYNIIESQIKYRTLNYLLPGSHNYLADRFFMTYCPMTDTVINNPIIGNSKGGIFGPFPYKIRIRGFYARVAITGNDSVAISLYAGTGPYCINPTWLVADTTLLDTVYKSLAIGTSGGALATMDTISPGHVIYVRSITGKNDSITIGWEGDTLLFPSITGLFEIIE